MRPPSWRFVGHVCWFREQELSAMALIASTFVLLRRKCVVQFKTRLKYNSCGEGDGTIQR